MDETIEASGTEKIMKVKSGWVPELELLQKQILELEQLARQGNSGVLIEALCRVVLTYRPVGRPAAKQTDDLFEDQPSLPILGILNPGHVRRSG